MKREVYRVTFDVTAKVTMEISASSIEEADTLAWEKYEDSYTHKFLEDAEITECVIDSVECL